MILIDPQDRRPIYEQIVEKLSDLMARGILKQDDPLPSVRSLATDLAINPNTVQRAYLELERQGYTYAVKGKGYFVSELHQIRSGKQDAVYLDLESLIARGKTAGIPEAEFILRVKQFYSDDTKAHQRRNMA